MKHASTHFLRAVIFAVGIGVLALCIFAFPGLGTGWTAEFPTAPKSGYVVMASFYAASVPFFLALFQMLKLLRYIDTNKAFSEESVRALQAISRYAIAMTVAFMTYMPAAFHFAEIDDAPGVILFAVAFACSPLVVAVIAAVLKKLLQSAVDMKHEHDLMV